MRVLNPEAEAPPIFVLPKLSVQLMEDWVALVDVAATSRVEAPQRRNADSSRHQYKRLVSTKQTIALVSPKN